MAFRRLKPSRPVRIFFVEVGLAISIVIPLIFVGIYLRTASLLDEAVRQEADSYFDLVVHTRQWNAGYGGVYVRKGPGVETNPFLRQLGVEPEFTAKDGTVLTMRNPAMMAREISGIVGREQGVTFHLFSDRPINPMNSPDSFEKSALAEFARGEEEVLKVDWSGPAPYYRLARPLRVEEPCLKCHGIQGYEAGDVRGGMVVSVPYAKASRDLKANRLMLLTLCVVTLGVMLVTLYVMATLLANRIEKAQERIRELSVTDELTGLSSRRYIIEKLSEEFERFRRTGKGLGTMMLDLDHFKDVNDTFGHPFGDAVLKEAARRIKSQLRPYDVAGRFGGEEFLVVCPDITREDMARVAERIRRGLQSEAITDGTDEVTVTTSIGITVSKEGDAGIEGLLKRADDALYAAKHKGRDRVEEL